MVLNFERRARTFSISGCLRTNQNFNKPRQISIIRSYNITSYNVIYHIILFIISYYRDQKTNQQRQFRNAAVGSSSSESEFGTEKARQKRSKKKAGPSVVISRLDMEEALVDLQLRTGCTVRMHETVQQLAEVIAMFTKGIAEAPFKYVK